MLYFSLLHLYGTNDSGRQGVILSGSEGSITVRLSPAYIKIRYPSHLTSTAFYFLYYFLILVFVFRFTLPGKYENRTHHGNHPFLYCFHY